MNKLKKLNKLQNKLKKINSKIENDHFLEENIDLDEKFSSVRGKVSKQIDGVISNNLKVDYQNSDGQAFLLPLNLLSVFPLFYGTDFINFFIPVFFVSFSHNYMKTFFQEYKKSLMFVIKPSHNEIEIHTSTRIKNIIKKNNILDKIHALKNEMGIEIDDNEIKIKVEKLILQEVNDLLTFIDTQEFDNLDIEKVVFNTYLLNKNTDLKLKMINILKEKKYLLEDDKNGILKRFLMYLQLNILVGTKLNIGKFKNTKKVTIRL